MLLFIHASLRLLPCHASCRLGCRLYGAQPWRRTRKIQQFAQNLNSVDRLDGATIAPSKSVWVRIQDAVTECVAVVQSGSEKFVPMIFLFFAMAFINTLLDNLKDTLIFTLAAGGGAHVVPWLQGELSGYRCPTISCKTSASMKLFDWHLPLFTARNAKYVQCVNAPPWLAAQCCTKCDNTTHSQVKQR